MISQRLFISFSIFLPSGVSSSPNLFTTEITIVTPWKAGVCESEVFGKGLN